MTPEDPDKRLRERIEKAFVPADLCSTDPAAVEALLDAAKAEPFPEDKVQRMLKKLRGELPISKREQAKEKENKEEEEEEPAWSETELTQEEKELVALYRNGGGELPPAIKEKLRRLRDKAKREPEEGEAGDD
jgi:hypothetical protein